MEKLATLKSLQCLNFLDANYPRNHLTLFLIFHAQFAVMGLADSRFQRTNQVPLRRKKREPGAPVGKNVVVLKACDVVERDETVFMPNTIEMAQLKKAERGQFKTNVQISSQMTETDIQLILVETFPFLEGQR